MKIFLKISLLLLLPLLVKSQIQQQQLDSLHYALKVAANDSIKMSILTNLGYNYIESNRDSALIFDEQALIIARKINQPIWIANLLLIKSYILQKQGNLPLVFKLINEAMDIAKDKKNEKNIYKSKLDGFSGDSHNIRIAIIAGGYHQLGNLYSQVGNYEKAIEYYKDEIRVAEEIKNYSFLVNSNMNIGSIYIELGKLDSAQYFCNKAWVYSNNTGYKTYQGYILEDIGKVYFKRKLLDSAKHYYRLAQVVNKKQDNLSGESSVNISIAELYESVQKADSLLFYSKQAFAIAIKLKSGNFIAKASELMSHAFKMQGAVDSAYAYLSLSKKMGDSLNNVRKEKLTQFQNINFEEQMQLEKKAQENVAYVNKVRTIALLSVLGILSVLAFVFYRNNRQKQKVNTVLESTLINLKSTQAQLIQSEKMASLGELTAGIAHEIQNQLNFVNNFSEVNEELLAEMKDELIKGNLDNAKDIANDAIENQLKIIHHGKRADDIVKGMLQHSRNTNNATKEPTDLNALVDEYLRLAYHGLRAKDKSFNAISKTDFDENIENINIIPQDIGRLILNLITNAFYVVDEKKKSGIEGYEPTVSISTKKMNDTIEIKVTDNGNGISHTVLDKIFQPFFTTKPTGQGTGLGLSLAYDIVKAHGGSITVDTEIGIGTSFLVKLPIS